MFSFDVLDIRLLAVKLRLTKVEITVVHHCPSYSPILLFEVDRFLSMFVLKKSRIDGYRFGLSHSCVELFSFMSLVVAFIS